jgi:hypothetical protein
VRAVEARRASRKDVKRLSRTRKLSLAAAVIALAAPAGMAVAEDPADTPTRSHLRAPLAGHGTVKGHMRDALRDRLRAEYAGLARRLAAASGTHRSGGSAQMSTTQLRRAIPRLREGLHRERRPPVSPVLERIARCESGGNPRAIGGGGMYRGAFQFNQSTWEAVGGTGDPAAAPLAEQYRRAAILLARSGPSQWPSCSA